MISSHAMLTTPEEGKAHLRGRGALEEPDEEEDLHTQPPEGWEDANQDLDMKDQSPTSFDSPVGQRADGR